MPTVLPLEMVGPLLSMGASARVAQVVAPRFKAGDAVLARNINPIGHTRLPRYIRGKHGVIRSDHGVFLFPDTAAHGLGHKAQHLYSVRFGAQELWGEAASERDSVYIDLFDDYLDRGAAAVAAARAPVARARPARSAKASATRKPPAKPKAAARPKPKPKAKPKAASKPKPIVKAKAASKSKRIVKAKTKTRLVAKSNKKPARARR